VVASLLAYDSSPLRSTVTLDKGSRSGVAPDAVLLYGGYVLGRVETVGPWTSRAVLLDDPASRVAVRCARSRVRGVLQGLGGGLCRVKYVPATADLRPGDLFVTSGGERIFPPGFPVGTCTRADSRTGEAFKWIEVRPAVEPSSLEQVVVLVRREEGGTYEE